MNMETLVESVGMGILLMDAQGGVTYANGTLAAMTGYPLQDLMGNGFYDALFRTPESVQRIREKALSSVDSPFDDLEMSVTCADDSKKTCTITGKAATVDGQQGILLTLQDVTNKRAYEKVIESSFDNFIKITMERDEALRKVNEQNVILENYKAKMTRELNIAKSVQKAIIPKSFPKIPHFEMYGLAIPSEELGGDYFDYFLLEEDKIGILIADVSGHGVPSSLITTMVKAYFEYYTKRFWEPEKVLQHVNHDMAAIIMDTGFYLTAFYAVLDLKARTLRVSSAGHDSAICVSKGREEAVRIGGEGADGTILGIFPDAEYQSLSYDLEPDSKFIIYTDGITEARADTGEFYGSERLEKFLKDHLENSSRETVEALIRDVDAFYGTNHPNDDRTLVVFDILSTPTRAFDPKKTFVLGKKLFKEKDYALALAEFETIVERQEDHLEAWYLAGQCQSHLGQYDGAVKSLSRCLELDPRYFKSYYYLGIVHHNQKNYAEARTCWEKVLELAGSYKDTSELLEKLRKKS